jgi:hypothetical protein
MPPQLGELEGFSHDWTPGMLTDNIFDRHVLLKGMQDKGDTYPGGLNIREGLIYNDDEDEETGSSTDETGEYDIVEVPGHDVALYQPRYYVQTIPLWDSDVEKNGTDATRYWDYVKERKSLCMRYMKARFARHLYSTSGGGTNILGLGDFMDNTATIGGIDRTLAGNQFWRSYVFNNGGVKRSITTRLMARLHSAISDGGMMPDVYMTSTDVFDELEALLDPQERFPNTTLAQMGFENITFRGLVPVVKDKYCDVSATDRHKIYGINFDHIRWRSSARFNMKRQSWMRMPNQLGSFMLIIWFGNVVINNPRRLGMIDDIDPDAHD